MSGIEIPTGREARAQHKTPRRCTTPCLPEVSIVLTDAGPTTVPRVTTLFRSVGTDAAVLARWRGSSDDARDLAARLVKAADDADRMTAAEKRGGT